MNKLNYKGYTGSIERSEVDNCFYGVILNIKGSFSYEGDNLESLEKDFHLAVEDYIKFRETHTKKRDIPIKKV